jgi:hypothetical protein
LRIIGISSGEGALTLEFAGERCTNFQISSGGGTLTLDFQGKGCINPGISREGDIPWTEPNFEWKFHKEGII